MKGQLSKTTTKETIMKHIKSGILVIVIILSGLFVVACQPSVTAETNGAVEATSTNAANDKPNSQAESVQMPNEAGAVSAVNETADSSDAEDEITRPDGWSDDTHSKSADPNYEVVFPEDAVNTMTITIDPDDWQAMLADMAAIYGTPGNSAGTGGRPGGGNRGGPLAVNSTAENPIWVAATIQFEGDIWTDVGVRFKGNSSLTGTWSSGSLELPFKLDFDEFEDQNPAIEDQRFYGFKQLSLSNNFNDATFMRDTVASDIFADAGLASAETAFYELYVDYGEGPVNFGLYTMIEVIDDTVIERFFGNDDGNIYEADGPAVSLAEGTYNGISTSFQKENNEEEADWSDIETLYTVLNSDTRQTDPETWKAELEAIFDVDTFLHWLAINTVIENWDTYGAMTHNFYLYNNPETGQLTWIPWDHNEALSESRRSNMTLGMEAVGVEWPLISYLLADSEYDNIYTNYVDETISSVFEADMMAAKYQEIANLIEPYATEKVGADLFARAVQALVEHTYTRVAEATRFLAE
jgi:hypothetical protein